MATRSMIQGMFLLLSKSQKSTRNQWRGTIFTCVSKSIIWFIFLLVQPTSNSNVEDGHGLTLQKNLTLQVNAT